MDTPCFTLIKMKSSKGNSEQHTSRKAKGEVPRRVVWVEGDIVQNDAAPESTTDIIHRTESINETKESNAASHQVTERQCPSSVTVSRPQLCIVLKEVVDMVARVSESSSDSNDYDFSALERLVPQLDREEGGDDEDRITLPYGRLDMIVKDLVRTTKACVENNTRLPTDITLPADSSVPDGRPVHLCWRQKLEP